MNTNRISDVSAVVNIMSMAELEAVNMLLTTRIEEVVKTNLSNAKAYIVSVDESLKIDIQSLKTAAEQSKRRIAKECGYDLSEICILAEKFDLFYRNKDHMKLVNDALALRPCNGNPAHDEFITIGPDHELAGTTPRFASRLRQFATRVNYKLSDKGYTARLGASYGKLYRKV
ncbi:MAG: hypothetical protein COA84_13500 [Robiginitomaculum sp.]|nr:MAG: hypothetical protein COA84_13500 [Robiginitomaculum sp.]